MCLCDPNLLARGVLTQAQVIAPPTWWCAAAQAQPQPALLLDCSSVAFNLNTQNASNWEGLQQQLRWSSGAPCASSLLVSVIFVPIGRSFSFALFWGSALPFPFPCVLIPVYNVYLYVIAWFLVSLSLLFRDGLNLASPGCYSRLSARVCSQPSSPPHCSLSTSTIISLVLGFRT